MGVDLEAFVSIAFFPLLTYSTPLNLVFAHKHRHASYSIPDM